MAMKINVNSINVRREGLEIVGLEVYFTGEDSELTINLNGYVPLTNEEVGFSFDIASIENLVKQKVVDRLMDTGETPAE